MRSLLYFAAVALVSASLAAQQTGRITGKVLDTAGKPITNAVVVLKRLDITFVKEIKVDAKGNFIQAGLEPKEYEMTVSAEGYAGLKETVKVPLNDVAIRNITLLTPDQMIAMAGSEKPAISMKANAADSAYTTAVGLYNDKNFAAAVEKFESAIGLYAESIASATDEALADDIRRFHAQAVDLLADCRFEVGKADSEQRDALWLSAEPVLKAAFDKLPDDRTPERARLAYQLGEIARMKGDAALAKKYSDALEKIEGPKVENAYNTAVALYNAGKLSEAKPHLKRAIEINPSFAETYYLLAICEYADMDMRAAKACLQKYLELDPRGKYAAEVKELLKEF